MARNRYIEEQIISVLNAAKTGDWKLLTYAWLYCRIRVCLIDWWAS